VVDAVYCFVRYIRRLNVATLTNSFINSSTPFQRPSGIALVSNGMYWYFQVNFRILCPIGLYVFFDIA